MVIKPNMSIYNMLLEQDYKHPLAEQDTLNIVFEDKIKQISSKYNYLNHLPLAHPDVEQDFSVFHFCYGKPWVKGNMLGSHQEMYDIWLSVAAKI
jgi:lipopolysaccharide biosynthesis glycosyltransferase